MYGLVGGATAVPSDIFNNKDGSLRSIPDEELRAIYWTMEKIFSCNMSSFPLAMLAHSFWYLFRKEMTHAGDYTKCLKTNGVQAARALHQCHRHIIKTCGTRFGEVRGAAKKCSSILWGNTSSYDFDHYLPKCDKHRNQVTDYKLPAGFKSYFSCLTGMGPVLTKCAVENLDRPCKEKKLRAMKTVRTNMKAGEYLLKSHRNTLLMHLYRDPRGAVRSRLQFTWSQGLGDINNITKEALLYCTQVLNDIHMRRELERHGYKERIKEIVYDEYVEEPLNNLGKLYGFIGQQPPSSVKEKYITNELLPKNETSKFLANKWKTYLTSKQKNIILKMCSQFYNETTYHWP